MTMGDGGTRVGAAHFGLGIDLPQLERDLARAEQLARASAERIQRQIGAIPVGAAPAGGPTQRAAPAGPRVATAAPAGSGTTPRQQQAADDLFAQAVADGKDPRTAAAQIQQFLGVRPRAANNPPPPTSTAGVPPTSAGRETVRARAPRGPRAPAPPQLRAGGSGAQGGGPENFFEALFPHTADIGVRAVGAFFGVGLGLSAAVGFATQLHQAIAQSVESAIELERATRSVGVAFGPAARQFTGPGAAAFARDPTTRGTTAQFLQAAASLGPTASQFGLTTEQIQQLVVAEGQLARLHGVELPQASQVFERMLRGDVEAGQALNLQLTDQYGRLRSVGLSFEELTAAVGRTHAEEILVRDIQADVSREMQNSGTQADDLGRKLDELGKHLDALKTNAGSFAAGPIGAGLDFLNAVATGQLNPVAGFGRDVARRGNNLPTQAEADAVKRALDQQTQAMLENERASDPANILQREATARAQRVRDATEQSGRAGIRVTLAQSQLDTLNIASDQRRLGVQQQLNELAQSRLAIEGQVAPLLLEQQRVQDRVAITLRENLNLTEQTLRAQQAAVGPAGAAQDLSFAQQRVRLLAQVQQSRAIRGLGPAPGIPGIPELFGQGLNLALAAPEVNLAAADAQHGVDVATRAQTAAQLGRQLGAIPDQRRLQALQDQLIPLQQAQSAAQAAADAIDRSLQGADLVSGPARIKAEQDLAAARRQQADAAAAIARAQSEQPGFSVDANATVTIEGLSDVQAVADQVLDAFRPQLIAAINDAINNPRPPAGPPTDRGGR